MAYYFQIKSAGHVSAPSPTKTFVMKPYASFDAVLIPNDSDGTVDLVSSASFFVPTFLLMLLMVDLGGF